ncbi:MAG: D-alanine--D-alanine ligase [Holophagaceae bacterium]|nr:D-alanine--D-alanine ligase [Holophagaceae bacterium]
MDNHLVDVGLLFGGESLEHEVSIVSARSVAQNLDPALFCIKPIGVARNGVWAVLGDPFERLSNGELPEKSSCPFLPLEAGAEQFPPPDVVFNIIHGAGGEDGQIQGYLELLKIPYTGAGRLALALTMDKWMAKRVWESEGLPVTPYRAISEEGWNQDQDGFIEQCKALGMPLFVKPSNSGSSVGIEKVRDFADLQKTIENAFLYDRRILVESGLDAREIEVAVLGGDDPIVSMPGEVLVTGEFYDFADKYVNGKSQTLIPAELDDELAKKIMGMARRAFVSIDGYGLARVDFFVQRETGDVFINEMNTIPGFTSISMFPKLIENVGIPYREQLTRLIELAIARDRQMVDKQIDFHSGSEWFSS